MDISPKFTIITITYNAAHWLERTVLSILSQSYPHVEYVIIDGGSTDGTVDMDDVSALINQILSK